LVATRPRGEGALHAMLGLDLPQSYRSAVPDILETESMTISNASFDRELELEVPGRR
jgi:hypothetical protein